MCGLCLPHCPTYQVSKTESESPRGRISLVKAFMQGQLAPSDALSQHLHSCTGCLNCQNVCPAKVEFEQIIDAGRSAYIKNLPTSKRLTQRSAITMLTTQHGKHLLSASNKLHKLAPVFRNTRSAKVLRLLNAKKLTSNVQQNSNVILFTGCHRRYF